MLVDDIHNFKRSVKETYTNMIMAPIVGLQKALGTSPFNARIDNSLFPRYIKSTPILFFILSKRVWLVCSIVKYFHESRCI